MSKSEKKYQNKYKKQKKPSKSRNVKTRISIDQNIHIHFSSLFTLKHRIKTIKWENSLNQGKYWEFFFQTRLIAWCVFNIEREVFQTYSWSWLIGVCLMAKE
jgi:hypothetical protein